MLTWNYSLSSTVIIFMTTIAGSLMFAMFGATTTGGLIPFAILYGFFSGCCMYSSLFPLIGHRF